MEIFCASGEHRELWAIMFVPIADIDKSHLAAAQEIEAVVDDLESRSEQFE